MSRGHGIIQRLILEELENNWHAALADHFGGWLPIKLLDSILDDSIPSTRASQEATRRAVKRLAAEGLVEIGYQGVNPSGDTRGVPIFAQPHNVPNDSGKRRDLSQLVVRLSRRSPEPPAAIRG